LETFTVIIFKLLLGILFYK